MSAPSCDHVPPLSEYTRTWPASVPPPSFKYAPIAMRVPSEDIDNECPAIETKLRNSSSGKPESMLIPFASSSAFSFPLLSLSSSSKMARSRSSF